MISLAWINNCVGLHNYAYFLLYTSYMGLSTTMALYPLYLTELEESVTNPIVSYFNLISYVDT
jgi:hypothetical protein